MYMHRLFCLYISSFFWPKYFIFVDIFLVNIGNKEAGNNSLCSRIWQVTCVHVTSMKKALN